MVITGFPVAGEGHVGVWWGKRGAEGGGGGV